jgi:ZIP family zinc transporter
MLGYIIFSQTDHHILSFALAMAAGALISMIADVLLPESYKTAHEFTGLFMALGFLLSFILSHL